MAKQKTDASKTEEFKQLPETEAKQSKKDKIKELVATIKDEYGIDVELSKNIKYKLEKVIDYINSKYEFRYNNINTDTEYRPIDSKEWLYFDDRDYRDVFLEVKMNNMSIADQDFKSMVYGSKISKQYNPFKEFFSGLPRWDNQTDHIKFFLQQVQLKDESLRSYFVEGFKKWFVALVCSLVEDLPSPFLINQTCLVLVGGQGKYKTTFLKKIIPQHLQLKYFYGSSFNFHNKDHEKYLAYKIIINLDEMAALNKTDIESAKSRITQDQVVVRLPYAKADIHLKRRASFTATQNNTEFLRDETGSRRWFVVEIDNICIDESFDVSKMYAQGLHLYREGYRYWFDREDMNAVEHQNEKFQLKNFEEEYLLKHYEVPDSEDYKYKGRVEYLSASDIADELAERYKKININNTVIKNIGAVLKKNGFEKVSVRRDEKPHPIKLWAVRKFDNLIFTPENADRDVDVI